MNNDFSHAELQVKEWLKKAYDDELNASSILKHRDGTPSGVCFMSHQMGEKYLKAFLVGKKKWFPKIHPLTTLTELCKEIDSSFEIIKDASIFLNAFYIPTRYPGEIQEFNWKDAEEAFTAALKIKEFVLARVKS